MCARNILPIAIILLASSCSLEQKASIDYPHPRPDTDALRYLPGVVSGDSLDFNASFSPDGKHFYFSRSAKGKWVIYQVELRDSIWSKPEVAPFNELEYSQADPFITSDGTLYFISNRPRHAGDTLPDYDIWLIRPQANGTWTKPENVESVNSDSTEYYVSLSANGNIYFASNREGTLGSHDLYVSRKINGVNSAPENLGPAINSKQMEHDPMISPNEQFLIFTSVDRDDTHGEGDLYYSIANKDGTWSNAKNMGSKFNSNTYEYCSYLSPDGKYIFFSSNFDVKWIDTKNFPWK
jgi:Tol biopolymer transport system component